MWIKITNKKASARLPFCSFKFAFDYEKLYMLSYWLFMMLIVETLIRNYDSKLIDVLVRCMYAKRIARTTLQFDINDQYAAWAYRYQASPLNGLHQDNVQALSYVCAYAIRRKVGRIR